VKDVMADDDAAEFLESRGIYATPVLQVDDALLVGFEPTRVDRLLGLTPPSDA
jgi:hypothetical protein